MALEGYIGTSSVLANAMRVFVGTLTLLVSLHRPFSFLRLHPVPSLGSSSGASRGSL